VLCLLDYELVATFFWEPEVSVILPVRAWSLLPEKVTFRNILQMEVLQC